MREPRLMEVRHWIARPKSALLIELPIADDEIRPLRRWLAIRRDLCRSIKLQTAVEKHGIPLAIDVAPADRHDTKVILPVLCELTQSGFRQPALGDLGYRGESLAEAAEAPGITVRAIAEDGMDASFAPASVG